MKLEAVELWNNVSLIKCTRRRANNCSCVCDFIYPSLEYTLFWLIYLSSLFCLILTMTVM